MRTSGKPSFFAPWNMQLAELELLVGRHVAVAAPAHVEVRAERALVEAVLVERRTPGADELVGDHRVRRQHLGCDDLDAGADAELGDPVEQAVEVEPAGPELGAGRVQREPELERDPRRSPPAAATRPTTSAGGAASRSVAVSVSVWRTMFGTYMPGPPSWPGAICM